MNALQITTLMDNTVYSKKLTGEHGLSMFIEAENIKVLFDTGQSPNFIVNAKLLGIDLSAADFCVISHGHYDHTGGLSAFTEINKQAPIMIHENAFMQRFNSAGEYVGMSEQGKAFSGRINHINGTQKISDNIYLMTAAPIFYPEDMHINGFLAEINGQKLQDDFTDELSLVIKLKGSLAVISGCSHRGISNIVRNASDYFKMPVSAVIGGFHIKNEDDDKTLKILEILRSLNIPKIWTSHCTGIEKFALMKNTLKSDVRYNYTGSRIILEDNFI